MNKDLHCPYSILSSDIICEHKTARIVQPNTVTLHNHDGYELILFLNGNVNIFVESEETKLVRGNLIIIPPYYFHGMRVANIDQYERIVLNLRPEILHQISDKETDFEATLHTYCGKKLNLISLTEKQLTEIISLLGNLEQTLNCTSFGHGALSRAYLIEFFVALADYTEYHFASEYKNTMSPVVKKIFRYIDANLYNELNVRIIAEALHHNSDYLGRVFKNATGGSLKYYINAKKIAVAQQLLRDGYPPFDVCFMLCFNNYSSFSRCFSKHIGLSPKQYALSRK